MTGGAAKVRARGDFRDCFALEFEDLLVTGGYGKFIGENYGFGGIWNVWPGYQFCVLGGQLIFFAMDEALYFPGTYTHTPPYAADCIYVAADRGGVG